jgi:hypothetical protein
MEEGFGGLGLYQDGRARDVGFFGGDIERVFGASPEALRLASSFRSYRIGGFIMYGAGLATMLGDLGLIVSLRSVDDTSRLKRLMLGTGLLLGGAIVSLIGVILLDASNSYLSDAVNEYNASLFDRYLPEEAHLDYGIMFDRGLMGGQVAFTF